MEKFLRLENLGKLFEIVIFPSFVYNLNVSISGARQSSSCVGRVNYQSKFVVARERAFKIYSASEFFPIAKFVEFF
jgi:hypothetical protein